MAAQQESAFTAVPQAQEPVAQQAQSQLLQEQLPLVQQSQPVAQQEQPAFSAATFELAALLVPNHRPTPSINAATPPTILSNMIVPFRDGR